MHLTNQKTLEPHTKEEGTGLLFTQRAGGEISAAPHSLLCTGELLSLCKNAALH